MDISPSRHIAIVGASPAGLVAARVLQTRGFTVDVFEADTSTDARDQGGTLDLHPDTGQKALTLAGLLKDFRKQARYEDQDSRLVDYKTAQPLFEEILPPGTGDRPEIDRKVLRDLLLASLRPGTVHWGHKLVAVDKVPTGECWQLTFADGSQGAFDLVIGANGAWSKVRSRLSDAVPAYTGVMFIECWLHDVDTQYPSIAHMVGHGTLFALHDNRGLIAQRNGDGHIRLYAAFRAPLGWNMKQRINLADLDQAKTALHTWFDGWAPQLTAMIDASLDQVISRPIYALPEDHCWQSMSGLTMIGDAAHLMPPVGFGVNLAMIDAAELAMSLTLDGDWEREITKQERIIQKRAHCLAPKALATGQLLGNVLR